MYSGFNIQGFRGFSDLDWDALGDVNLIVGKNSVGKSTLLDVVWVFARRGEPSVFWEIAQSRDEMAHVDDPSLPDGERRVRPEWRSFFWGRPERSLALVITGWTRTGQTAIDIRIGPSPTSGNRDEQRLLVEVDDSYLFDAPLDSPTTIALSGWRGRLQPEPCAYVRSNIATNDALAKLWESVAGTPSEEFVVRTLQTVVPQAKGLRFIPSASAVLWRPVVSIGAQKSVVPLRSLGEGAVRLTALSMAIAATSDGIVLIDEFENGLHWSVQPMIWRAIIDQAKKQNVQLFVTTHSSDTVNAFSDAVRERTDVEGALFRLEQTEGGIRSVRLDEQSLEVFRRRGWESR